VSIDSWKEIPLPEYAECVCPPSGPEGARVALVGMAPGKEELMKKEPFVGPAGRELDRALHSVGVPRRGLYLTNVLKFMPPDHQPNRVDPAIVQASKEALLEELESLPDLAVVVPLGDFALETLSGYKRVSKWRGSVLPQAGWRLVPTYHPSWILRAKFQDDNMHALRTFAIDLKKAWEERFLPPLPEQELLVEPSFDDASWYLSWLLEDQAIDLVAFDIEVLRGHTSCISLCGDGKKSMSIPLIQGGQSVWEEWEEASLLRQLDRLFRSRKAKIAHNASFDASTLFQEFGLVFNNLHCSMIAHRLAYPDYPMGLDFCTSLYTRLPYYKDEGKVWNKVKWDELEFFQYNAKDSLAGWQVGKAALEQVNKAGNLETYTYQTKLVEAICAVEHTGLLVDTQAMASVRETLAKDIEEKQGELAELGFSGNVNSPKQVAAYFYETRGAKPYLNNEGRYSVNDQALRKLASKGFKEASLLRDIRAGNKLINTYYSMSLDPDSRMRCSVNPVGSRFGRMSTSKTIRGTGMNMQNQPREMKRFFVAPEGYFCCEVDLSQAENRIVAYIAPEPRMIEAFESGIDIHSQTAAWIFNKPLELVSREAGSASIGGGRQSERHWGKKANHSLNYMEGPNTFAAINEISAAESKRIIRGYFAAYPGVKAYHQWVSKKLREDRRLENLLGRKYLFSAPWSDRLLKRACAFIPQSTTADIINRRGYLWLYQHPEFVLVNQVHDSVWFYAPLGDLEHTAEQLLLLKESLETPLSVWGQRELVIPADFSVGFDFYSTKGLDTTNQESMVKTLKEAIGRNRDSCTVQLSRTR